MAAARQILVGAYWKHEIGRTAEGRNGRTPRRPYAETAKSRDGLRPKLPNAERAKTKPQGRHFRCGPSRSEAVSEQGRFGVRQFRLSAVSPSGVFDLRPSFLSPQFRPSPPTEPECPAVLSSSFSRCPPLLAPLRKRSQVPGAPPPIPICGSKISAALGRWLGWPPRTRRRQGCSRRILASPRCSATRWRSRRRATGFRTCASSAASSTTSGRTVHTCAASGVGRRWRVIAPRRLSGRQFSISTRWRARRRRTGSGKAPTAHCRPSDGACSVCRTGAKTPLPCANSSSPRARSRKMDSFFRTASRTSRGSVRTRCSCRASGTRASSPRRDTRTS